MYEGARKREEVCVRACVSVSLLNNELVDVRECMHVCWSWRMIRDRTGKKYMCVCVYVSYVVYFSVV